MCKGFAKRSAECAPRNSCGGEGGEWGAKGPTCLMADPGVFVGPRDFARRIQCSTSGMGPSCKGNSLERNVWLTMRIEMPGDCLWRYPWAVP